MDQQPPGKLPMPSIPRRLFAFLLSEIKGLALAFWRPAWKVSLILTILIFVLLAFLVFRADPPQPAAGQAGQDPPLALKLLYILIFSLILAIPAGLVSGLLGAIWRLCGWGILVPVFAIPLAVMLSTWLCSGWVANEGREALVALQTSAEAKGLPETAKALERVGKVAHGGGIEMLAVVAILLLPFLAADAFGIMVDPTFLWQFTQFVLAVVFAVCLGLIPSTLLSLFVLSFTIVRRLRQRYLSFLKAFEDAAQTASTPASEHT